MAKKAGARPKQKAKPKLTDKEQSERFIETARELDADESGKKFESTIDRILTSSQPTHNRTYKKTSGV